MLKEPTVTISGSPRVGQTLTASSDGADFAGNFVWGVSTSSNSVVWQGIGVGIGGTDNNQFTIPSTLMTSQSEAAGLWINVNRTTTDGIQIWSAPVQIQADSTTFRGGLADVSLEEFNEIRTTFFELPEMTLDQLSGGIFINATNEEVDTMINMMETDERFSGQSETQLKSMLTSVGIPNTNINDMMTELNLQGRIVSAIDLTDILGSDPTQPVGVFIAKKE
jgi:hypothetical protein